ncbi:MULTISPECIES: 2-oxoglutarate dehydrogenase, E2 component, dihydrolipoamide succinyltransferase [unclassified Pseudonocardia]|uniref:2-oxoglutarate dehydrogenase, E2 component, dihydrolipoamide succinyltransferase n=1 Tax=unclassified Pseudonocardia TaxID=2619320 RepID=UPI0001FFE886|nr:2-oxoglutarate dehydrogenase, E2 component, dihydrolipoamide succinyltransferase [Pseudonocardia sp. Ae707_Ps1]OLM19488.1 Dihydrolipoamide acyltransferase component of branched-chain alpha-keto acid dehydrogenase complex [Pseudonocardia sp. Ae707_Ps1]
MAVTVEMPALGESVTEGTVTRWLKAEGDTVEVDEPLLEVSTDKVDTEIPSPAAGVLKRIIAGEDETVEVGGELAVIGDAGEADTSGGGSGGSEQAAQEAEPEPEPAQEEAPAPKQEPGGSSGGGSGSPVTMPELGESVTEGTVTRWLKQVGESVEVDEPLLEVSTDKVDTEIPSPVAGTVLEHTVGEDETVEVGAQLALVGDGSAAPAQQEAPAPKEEPEQEAPKQPEPKPEPTPAQPKAEAPKEQAAAPKGSTDTQGGASSSNGSGEKPYVTPLVRKLAQENGVDLESVTGSGVGGRIRKQDVLAAAEQKSAPAPAAPAAPSAPAAGGAPKQPQAVPTRSGDAPEPGTTVKLPRLRQVIAQRMTESLSTSAQLTTVQEIDLTRIVKLRNRVKEDFKKREGANLTFLAFIAKATIEALKAFPSLNASISEDAKQVTYHGPVHMGIAVDTPRGLLVPVIKDADDLSLAGIAKKIADVAARTRDGKIGPDELSGGTFTITNIGSAGALFDTPIINQPQVGILGTGAIAKEPKVVAGPEGEDVIAIRSVCYLPLTYDHRLVDGADAGRFLSAVRARLEEGAFEAELGL